MKLYVKNIVREPNDTLYTFLYKVLSLDGNGFGRATVKDTYFDPEFKKQQCISHKYRSFDDIVSISKTYFRVSDKAVAKVIIKFLNNDKNYSLVICDAIDKWVFYYGLTRHTSSNYCAKYNGGFGKIDTCGVGIYSYNDILVLAGLEKEEGMDE
jgi:hypothetical protein